MEQYIDKAVVVTEIERRIKINKECMLGLKNLDYYQGKVDALNEASEFIKKHFEETPQDELDKEWKEIEPLNDIGPDVLEYADKIKKMK